MSLMFFVRDVEVDEPEFRNLEIFIGESTPDVPEGVTIRTFKAKRGLRSFLMRGEWDRVTIYKSPECPQEVVDDLYDWLSLHMGLGKVVTFKEGKDGQCE